MNIENCEIRTDDSKRELQAHGSADFPSAAYYSVRDNTEMSAVQWHWHSEFEILHIKSGQCRVQVPGEEHTLKEGMVAVINANTLHYAVGDPLFELESFVFSHLLITGDESSVFYQRYIRSIIDSPLKIWITDDNEVREFFRRAYEAQKNEEKAFEFTVRENLSRLMLSVFYSLPAEKNDERRTKDIDTVRIEKMLDYIHSHYRESITLGDIASAAVLGEREALRCFSRTISVSPMQYLMKYRLRRSAALLRERPELSISEITSLSGFDYPSYFSKLFRRYYSCTPKEYRKS